MNLVLETQTANEWHVMKGETQYGPYSYAEMLQMLQNKMICSYDFIWAAHMDAWAVLGDQPEFSADRVIRVLAQSPNNDVFARRRHKRVDCFLPVLVHDNQRMWDGHVHSLSEGGALIAVQNPFLLPGDQLIVHFCKTHPTANGFAMGFNTRVEILNKRLSKQKLSYDLQLLYAVQFTQVPDTGRTMINSFVSKDPQEQVSQGE